VRPADLARWGEQLTDLAARVDSYEQWKEVQEHAVVPQVAQAFLVLDRAFGGSPLAGAWEKWRERYGPALDALLEAIARRAVDRSRARAGAVSRAIDPVLPEPWKTRPLSQKALAVVASVPGVTTVLVGMRSREYVEDVIGMMTSAPLPDAVAALGAAAQANVPGF
jgi:aryl-alcohol dehydrogenase-like predicted oxidoreductase